VINLDKGTIENKIKASHPKNIVVNSATNKVYAATAEGVLEINGISKNL
jgi:DNA-binding beta-propeller fold protein YncE